MKLESTAIAILEGDEYTAVSKEDTMELIEHLQAWLPNYPKGSNKYIQFLTDQVAPVYAVYGIYSAVDNGSLELTSRNFQSMMLFESKHKDLVKHLENTDKKTNFFESMRNGTDISKVELELTSPFCLQPEDEIGTGTYEHKVAIEDLFNAPDEEEDDPYKVNAPVQTQTSTPTRYVQSNPAKQPMAKVHTKQGSLEFPMKDILDTATKKVLGVGVKQDEATQEVDRDEHYVYTQYLYQFSASCHFDNRPTISVASEKFWNENGCLDDQEISKHLEHLIPDWADNWLEDMESVFTYIGKGDKADAIAYLKATGFFKHEVMFKDDNITVLMEQLEGQSADVLAKVLRAALDVLDEDELADLVQMYEDGSFEED